VKNIQFQHQTPLNKVAFLLPKQTGRLKMSPLPKPRDNEEENDFISRCMSVIADEYEDNDQALAICGTQWREREKSMKEIERKAIQVELKEDKEGSFTARIVTLDAIDKDGDVTISKAFPNKKVLVSAYQHGSWQGALPVGKADFREEDSSILGLGELNLKTIAGREHYETLKFAPELIEWSYGFKVLQQGSDKEIDDWSKDHDGARPARILKKVDPFEISPVLLGAGVNTATLAIKSTYTDQGEAVLAAVTELVTRTKSLADLRQKEGRVLSSANRERMKKLLTMLSGVASDLKELLDATEPVDDEKLAQAVLLYTKIKRELTEVL